MFGNILKMKEQMEEAKLMLEEIFAHGVAGEVTVKCDGTRRVLDVKIDVESLAIMDKGELQDLIVLASNRAFEESQNKAAVLFKDKFGSMAPGLLKGLM
jgi:DNA-binding protein YbaB